MARVNYKRLTERVEFTEVVRVANSSGGFDATHQSLFSTYASVKPKASNLVQENGRVVKIQTYEVGVRDREGLVISAKWNMNWRGNRYQINSDPEVDVENRMLVLTVTRAS